MKNEDRRKASIDLSTHYLSSFYSDWRLVKILATKKQLSERYDFYKEIFSELGPNNDLNPEAFIAQEIKHGLYFDAISTCVQYVEDLFALLKSAKQPDFFIRNLINYDAGKVTSFIKQFKNDPDSISEHYHFPKNLKFSAATDQNNYDQGFQNLIKLTEDIITFYKKYEFFHNQYKHGLTVPMRPFGNIFDANQIAKDKKGQFEPYLAVYDNLNFSAAAKKGRFNVNHGVLLPGFTENVRPFINELGAENNLLRFVFPPDIPNFNIDLLVDQAKKTRVCIHVFIANYSKKIQHNGGKLGFDLPSDYNTYKIFTCTFQSTG